MHAIPAGIPRSVELMMEWSESIRNLLVNPTTDIQLINKIKEHGKILSQKAQVDIEHDTANAIYYAAIAHALVCHNLKITKFSYEELEKSFPDTYRFLGSFGLQFEQIGNAVPPILAEIIARAIMDEMSIEGS